MSKLVFYLERKLAALLLRAFRASIRFEVVNQPTKEHEPVIYAFWHRNLMYCTLQRAGDPVVVMISSSKDGELIAGPVEDLGFIPVRGSSTRQGSEALKGMLRWASTNPLAITPDGPKGPWYYHHGLWQIAILARSQWWEWPAMLRENGSSIPGIASVSQTLCEVRIRYSEPSLWMQSDIPTAKSATQVLKDYDRLF
jgi:hypothetical protein